MKRDGDDTAEPTRRILPGRVRAERGEGRGSSSARSRHESGALVRIRDPQRAHTYDRSELAEAMARQLRDSGLEVPEIAGGQNPFLVTLQRGSVENFGNHFSDNRNTQRSIGDERERW
jgi:hypothetical protein